MIKQRFEANFHERTGTFKVWDCYGYYYYKYDTLNFETENECKDYIDNITETYTTFYERKNGDTFMSEKHYKDLKNVQRFMRRK